MIALRGRKTWELTRDEFVKLACQEKLPKSRSRIGQMVSSVVEQQKRVIKKKLRDEIIEYQDVPEDIFERVDPNNIASSAHYQHVKAALQVGFEVPWRAIKDYRDLCIQFNYVDIEDAWLTFG